MYVEKSLVATFVIFAVMSELTRLKVHYGVGTIREGPQGVDLSDFQQVDLVHPNLENA